MNNDKIKTNDVFRSRGFRYDNEKGILTMKVYYEADYRIVNLNKHLKDISTKLKYFEYSVGESGMIDSVNYHTDCERMECELPGGEGVLDIKKIRTIFDSSFRAYTIGYRLVNMEVVGRSIYYYPTIWKGNRYGQKGITDTLLIQSEIYRFAKTLQICGDEKEKLMKFISIMTKFKGCCITESNKGDLIYKLYGKIPDSDLINYFNNTIDVNELNRMYGDTVLCSVRIRNKEITGYNLYYIQ